MRWPPPVMTPEPPRSTFWRDKYAKYLWPMFHVPKMVDDIEVQHFLEQHFLMFKPDKSVMTADQLIDAATERFGRIRCEGLSFWEH